MSKKTGQSQVKGATKSAILEVADPSSLTDADWASLNALRRAYEHKGSRDFSAELKKLARDPIMAGFVGFLPAFFLTLLCLFGEDRWLETAMFWTAGGILAASSRIRARSE